MCAERRSGERRRRRAGGAHRDARHACTHMYERSRCRRPQRIGACACARCAVCVCVGGLHLHVHAHKDHDQAARRWPSGPRPHALACPARASESHSHSHTERNQSRGCSLLAAVCASPFLDPRSLRALDAQRRGGTAGASTARAGTGTGTGAGAGAGGSAGQGPHKRLRACAPACAARARGHARTRRLEQSLRAVGTAGTVGTSSLLPLSVSPCPSPPRAVYHCSVSVELGICRLPGD